MSERIDLVLKGTRYYSAWEEYRKGRLKLESEVFLVHTPYNPHDSNAVAVYLMPAAKPLGHLSRQVARKYSVFVDDNRIKSAKVISVNETSQGILRIEIRLLIGPRKKAPSNNVTGTTQILPSALEPLLRKDQFDSEKAHYDSAKANVTDCELVVASAKATSWGAQDKLIRNRLSEGEQVSLRQLVKMAESQESKKRWGSIFAGIVIGGMAGGTGGAILGGIVGFVASVILEASGDAAKAHDKLQQYESSRREFERFRQELRVAEDKLRIARAALPSKPRSGVGTPPPIIEVRGKSISSSPPKRRSYTQKPKGSGPAYPITVNCKTCGGEIRFLSTHQKQWQTCPGCGFTRRRIG